MTISRANVGKKSNLCIPRVAHTHKLTHTKGEPCQRLPDPFLLWFTISETSKNLSIADLYKNPLLHLVLTNNCSVKERKIHRMSFLLLVNNLLSQDCQALHKDALLRTPKKCKQTNKHQIFNIRAAVSTFCHLLTAARRMNFS